MRSFWVRLLLPFLIVLLTSVGCWYVYAINIRKSLPQEVATDHSPTEVMFEPSEVDLGTIPIGTTIPFSANLLNAGSKGQDLLEIQTNCGCANVRTEKPYLTPGERTKLEGVYHATNAPGSFRRTITVLIGKPPVKPALLHILGTVERTLVVSPEELVLHPDFVEGKPAELKLN